MGKRVKEQKVKRAPVDWSKVPVLIEGTPNPEAMRLIVQSIREFELDQAVKREMASSKNVVERGSISS